MLLVYGGLCDGRFRHPARATNAGYRVHKECTKSVYLDSMSEENLIL
jgi:hypothetical protein